MRSHLRIRDNRGELGSPLRFGLLAVAAASPVDKTTTARTAHPARTARRSPRRLVPFGSTEPIGGNLPACPRLILCGAVLIWHPLPDRGRRSARSLMVWTPASVLWQASPFCRLSANQLRRMRPGISQPDLTWVWEHTYCSTCREWLRTGRAGKRLADSCGSSGAPTGLGDARCRTRGVEIVRGMRMRGCNGEGIQGYRGTRFRSFPWVPTRSARRPLVFRI